MSEIKVRVAVKSPHWDDHGPDKWLVSTNSFTIGEFWEHEVELEFSDGGTLPFGDIDWATDEVLYLQFTGLKDSKDKEVYDGDILEGASDASGGENLNVYWSDELGGWYIFQMGHEEEPLADHLYESARVIGNVYEHRDLLKL